MTVRRRHTGLLGCAVAQLVLAALAQAQPAGASEPDLVESVETVEPASGVAEGEAEDIVERIDGVAGAEPVSSATPAPQAMQAEQIRVSASGWARESLELYFNDDGLRRDDPSDVLDVPRDRILSRTQLLVRASYQKGRWFEAAVSGALGVAVHVEGSGRDLGVSGWQSQGTVEVFDGALRELYLGFFGDKVDLRIGQQRVAWGVADVLSPNDVVNARDFRDPFLSEPELNRIPTPLLRIGAYLGPVTLEGLVAPVFVPDRASLYGSNWSAIQPGAPAAYRGLFSMIARTTDPSVREQLNAAFYQTRLPNRNGQGVSAGSKLGIHAAALDLNLYYHYGFDGTPYVWLNPALAGVLERTDFTTAGFADFAPVLRALDQGVAPMFAEYVRRHHAGFDLVAPLGPVVLRLDAAYQTQRVFYTTELTSFTSPAVLGVLSLDYQTGSVDKVLVVEGVYVRMVDAWSSRLLAYEQDTYGVAAVLRWPLFSVFSLEARAMIGIAPYFYLVQPALVTKLGSFAIRVGGLVLDGDPYSVGGYYHGNQTAYLQIRYGF